MCTRTGGMVLTAGTTLPDAKNLLYNVYKKKTIDQKRKHLYTVVDIYKSIALRSQDEADDFWGRFLDELTNWGLYSDNIQSQYFVSFDIKGDRWVTVEQLEANESFKIAKLGIEKLSNAIVSNNNRDRFYRIASFDSAKKNDFAALILGLIEVRTDSDGYDNYYFYITDFMIINDEELTAKTILDPNIMNERVMNICQKHKIDMVVYEASANQSDRAFYLQQKFNKRRLPIKTIPIDYGGKNKERMFLKSEMELAGKKVFLPEMINTEFDKGYKEFIDQLKIFKKTYTGTTIKFAAPDGKGLHDDFISAFSQFIYLPYLIEYKKEQNATVGLGNSEEFDYYYDFYKSDEADSNMENVNKRTVYTYK